MSGGANDLEVVSRGKSVATAYHYRFKWGWAIFTINDVTGEFAIQSDWGDFCHRWHIDHLGEGVTLTEFLKSTDSHYVLNKLKVPADEIDEDATRAKLVRKIIEARREGNISKDSAKRLKAEALGLDIDESVPPELSDELEHIARFWDDPGDFFARRETHQSKIFKRLFEMFARDLRDGIEEVKASRGVVLKPNTHYVAREGRGLTVVQTAGGPVPKEVEAIGCEYGLPLGKFELLAELDLEKLAGVR